MTIERANEIVDGIASVLTSRCYVGGIFIPLSKTGASSRTELSHAVYIVVAQVFQHRGKGGSADNQFATFARAAGGSLFSVLFSTPCLPDAELCLIATLERRTLEFSRESSRLQELAMHEMHGGATQLETVDSFVSFLQTLDTLGSNYWIQVYQRIGLACPSDLVPTQTQPHVPVARKPWWRIW